MKLLLDTHAFIWWFNEPEKLSTKALAILTDRGHEVFLSVVSVWEMQIKMQAGKLKLAIPLRQLVREQVQTNGLRLLPVVLKHVLTLDSLPAHHKDPFDRLLVAQANVEGVFLVSSDPVFSSYPVKLLW